MEDRITLDRIKLLHPKVRAEVEHIYRAQIVPALSGRAKCRFAYTLRTFQEQADIFAIGRTRLFDDKGNRLGKVTNAGPGQSIHNYGLALDIVLIVDRDGNGTYESTSFETAVDYDKDGKADWMEVVNILKSNGWEWGGDWRSFKDLPHFQKDFGYTWQQLKAKHDAKDFIPGTNYVRI
ncbi:MAG: M15 family peptidase [Proteobacteria bacterium]|nr:M15 family peptidase [Pseudomonadota bacterium]